MKGKGQRKLGIRFKVTLVSLLVIAIGLVFIGYSYLWKSSTKTSSRKKKIQKTETNRKKGNESQQANNEDIIVYKNTRFGFEINHPKTWQTTESQNGDGVKLTSALEKNLIVRVYGFNNVLQDSLPKIIADRESWEKEDHPDLEIIERHDTKVNNLPAIEATWEYTAAQNDNPLEGKIKKQTVVLLKGEVGYSLELLTSKETFGQYSQIFSDIVKSFKLN